MPTSNVIRQLPIEFPHRPSLDKEDFLVAECNIEAVEMIDRWPDCRISPSVSMAAKAAANRTWPMSFPITFPGHDNYPYRIPSIQAKDVRLETPHKLFSQHRCLIVENLCRQINNEAMFHLYNLYRNEGGFILFTSEIAPARLNLPLPDLQSRLNAVPAIEIKARTMTFCPAFW